jgi:hypothetical protein
MLRIIINFDEFLLYLFLPTHLINGRKHALSALLSTILSGDPFSLLRGILCLAQQKRLSLVGPKAFNFFLCLNPQHLLSC